MCHRDITGIRVNKLLFQYDHFIHLPKDYKYLNIIYVKSSSFCYLVHKNEQYSVKYMTQRISKHEP